MGGMFTKVLFLVATAGCVLQSCTEDKSTKDLAASKSEPGAVTEPIHDFSKHLTGTIGKHVVTMELQLSNGSLRGTYFYHNVGLPLRLQGRVSDTNHFRMVELAPNGDTTGIFTGLLKNEEGLNGLWTNIRTNEQFEFILSERDTGGIKVVQEIYEKSNCSDADSIKAIVGNNPENSYDTLCTSRSIELLRFTLPDKKLADELYSTLLEKCALTVSAEPSVESMLSAVNGPDLGFEDGINVHVATNTHLILSVDVSYAAYWFGAAHPNSESHSYNFDLRNAQLIGLDDILKEGYQDKLERIAKKIFQEEYGADREFFLSEDFTISPGSLLFTYDPYEIGSYAEGYIGVFIPYGKIRQLIRPGSVLDVWLKGM